MQILPLSLNEIVKQLPPSGANLQLMDVSDSSLTRDFLTHRRPDVQVVVGEVKATSQRFDAVLAAGTELSVQQVATLRGCLRPGGRFIGFNPRLTTPEAAANLLAAAGFARILAERLPDGILYRGEQPYDRNLSTQERVSLSVDRGEADWVVSGPSITAIRGRYVQVLVRQTPNIPAWRLARDATVEWHMAALQTKEYPILILAFDALPKAVAWMQHAVLNGFLADIHRIVKFNKATAAHWNLPLLLNSEYERVIGRVLSTAFIEVDPQTAELPDE